MKVETIEAVKAYGFSVRTTNTDEIDPAKAKIGQLWQGFFDQALKLFLLSFMRIKHEFIDSFNSSFNEET